ncbi:MAG TPA: hypothetical protein VF516_25700 [Kofleriaceae bacterium]
MAGTGTFDDFHLGEGGLLRRLEVKCHLTKLPWQILGVVLVTWVPIVVLGVLERSGDPRLSDLGMHVRLLVAAPVLLYLDLQFPKVCRRTILQLVEQEFIPEAEQPRLVRTLRAAARLADSRLPELVLAVVGIGLSVASFLRLVPFGGTAWRTVLTPAQLWYAVIALPLFEFLLLRSLWRWAIWVRVLVGLARIDLDLEPTHPDCRGGIAFLRMPSIEYCATLLFVVASVVCATWHGWFASGATVVSFAPLLLLFATIGTVVAFGPLLMFTPRLGRVRRAGLVEIGGLAAKLGRQFRQRWIQGRALVTEADASADAQALAAIGSSYRDSVHRLRTLLFDRRDLLVLIVATAIPVVPVMIARIPREDWVKMAKLIGGSFVPI